MPEESGIPIDKIFRSTVEIGNLMSITIQIESSKLMIQVIDKIVPMVLGTALQRQ